jgi:hypothetical protein
MASSLTRVRGFGPAPVRGRRGVGLLELSLCAGAYALGATASRCAESLWIRPRGRTALWALAPAKRLAFPKECAKPLPIIGVRRAVMQGGVHDDAHPASLQPPGRACGAGLRVSGGAGLANSCERGVSPGILGFGASDAYAIGIGAVPEAWDQEAPAAAARSDEGVFSGPPGVGGFVDSRHPMPMPSASGRSTSKWTPVDSRRLCSMPRRTCRIPSSGRVPPQTAPWCSRAWARRTPARPSRTRRRGPGSSRRRSRRSGRRP